MLYIYFKSDIIPYKTILIFHYRDTMRTYIIGAAAVYILFNSLSLYGYDLNSDGFDDIVFSNFVNKSNYIYWGTSSGYSSSNKTVLPSEHVFGNTVADLNQDGYLDLVFCNEYDSQTHFDIDSYIYWGSATGYTAERRTSLPTSGAHAAAVADLNLDGHPDIVFTSRCNDSQNYNVDSYIYWGSDTGYSASNRTGLPTSWGYGCSIDDLNADQYPDIVFSNCYNGTSRNIDSYIYWGSPDGFSTSDRTGIPTSGASDNTITDLNGDGCLDIIFSSYTDGTSTICNSYIYWGDKTNPYSTLNRTLLPTIGANSCSAADLNNDGYPDLVFSNYHGPDYYSNVNSYIYWGGETGYSASDRTELPTLHATGNVIADVDNDGWLDIIFANFFDGVSNNISSYIYYGSAEGFSISNRSDLNTWGAQGISAGVMSAYSQNYIVPEPLTIILFGASILAIVRKIRRT